ncbi:MAG TPA: hypothetical protein VGF44_00975 [Terriglobales bacterium]|jgi:hypothetical protein
MCPACISGTAMLLAGLMTTGGLTAFIAPSFFRRAKSPETNDQVEKYKPLNEDQTD